MCPNVADKVKEVLHSLKDQVLDRDALTQRVATLEQELAREKESRPAPVTPTQVLDALTEQEVLTRFSKTVLDNLTPSDVVARFSPEEILGAYPLPKVAGYTTEHLVRIFESGVTDVLDHLTRPAAQTPPVSPLESHVQTPHTNGKHVKTPRVLVVGLKPEQGTILCSRLRGKVEIVVLDKNRKSDIPKGYDAYLVWTRFTSHSIQASVQKSAVPGTVLLYHGGLDRMGSRILGFFEN